MITYSTHEQDHWVLTEEGSDIASQGSHEAKVFYAIPEGAEGLSMDQLTVLSTFLEFLFQPLARNSI
jgi:phenylalanyl-tRNA synthetase alpha chain